jgi:hypothetical protein
MVEIIGWLGCLYLFVKGLEIIGAQRAAYGRMHHASFLAALLAIAGAIFFALVLYGQAQSVSNAASLS